MRIYVASSWRNAPEVLMDPDPELPRCIDCGCTEQLACPGGCYWADSTRLGLPEVPLCSQCYGRRAAHLDGRAGGLHLGVRDVDTAGAAPGEDQGDAG